MHEKRFDKDAEVLRSPERIARLGVEQVIDLSLEGITPQSVLDVGCGSGLFSQAFANRGLRVSGIDVNPEMLKIAAGFLPWEEFREGIAENIPYPDKSFDMVFMGVVLHETDDPLQALKEAGRVARTTVSILEWPYREEENGPPLEHRLSPEKIKTLAEAAGLNIIETIELANTVFYRLNPID